MFYVDYILKNIILDVEHIAYIWNMYTWYTSPFHIILWILIIGVKNVLLLLPVMFAWNLTIGQIKGLRITHNHINKK